MSDMDMTSRELEDVVAYLKAFRRKCEDAQTGYLIQLQPHTFDVPKHDAKWTAGRSRVSACWGICTRGGRVSAAAVDAVPSELQPLVRALAHHHRSHISTGSLDDSQDRGNVSVLVEFFDRGRWCPPRFESTKEFTSPTVLIALGGDLSICTEASARPQPDGTYPSESCRLLKNGASLAVACADEVASTRIGVSKTDSDILLVTLRRVLKPPKIKIKQRQPSTPKEKPVPRRVDDEKLQSRLSSATATPDIERKHVHEFYDAVSEHWHSTRHTAWPRVKEFIQGLPSGSLVADVGCGNGKYMDQGRDIVMLGSDTSINLLQICRRRSFEVAAADVVALPFLSNMFDAAISVAVLHHLSTEERRLLAVREILRILRPGGSFLIQAWALEQGSESRRLFPGQDVFVPWNTVASSSSTSSAEHEVHQRFCHVFRRGELDQLVQDAGGIVEEAWYDTSNWCVVGRKP